MILVIDTSGKRARMILAQDTEIVSVREWDADRYVGRKVIEHLEAMLQECSCSVSDIRRVGVCPGPGQFSALRHGFISALGISHGVSADLVEVVSGDAKTMIREAYEAEPVSDIRPKYI